MGLIGRGAPTSFTNSSALSSASQLSGASHVCSRRNDKFVEYFILELINSSKSNRWSIYAYVFAK
jgi:hypothetical protein